MKDAHVKLKSRIAMAKATLNKTKKKLEEMPDCWMFVITCVPNKIDCCCAERLFCPLDAQIGILAMLLRFVFAHEIPSYTCMYAYVWFESILRFP